MRLLIFASGVAVVFLLPPVTAGQSFPAWEGRWEEPRVYQQDATVHLVFVGFDPNAFDPNEIVRRLPTEHEPKEWQTWQVFGEFNSSYTLNLKYQVHFASEQFEKDLFAFYEEIRFRSTAPEFLKRYDVASGENRLGPLAVQDQTAVDYYRAKPLEDWIANNRAKYGLRIPENEYQLFFFNSWSKGLLPKDRYYYYAYANRTPTNDATGTDTMRVWGGRYNFLWQDVSAAPAQNTTASILIHVLWGAAGEGFSFADLQFIGVEPYNYPVWDFEKGRRPMQVHLDNLVENTRFALFFRFFTGYQLHALVSPKYHIAFHLIQEEVDGDTPITADWVDLPSAIEQIGSAAPWAEWSGDVHVWRVPSADPGLQRALDDARKHCDNSCADLRTMWRYFRDNEDRFFAGPPGAEVISLFYVYFRDNTGLIIPNGGVAVGFFDPDATACCTFIGGPGSRLTGSNYPASYGSVARVSAHEAGHAMGYPHMHDGVAQLEDGSYEYTRFNYDNAFWLWGHSSSVMSYQIAPSGPDIRFQRMDYTNVQRLHIATFSNRALGDIRITQEAFARANVGPDNLPNPVDRMMEDIRAKVDEIARLTKAGRLDEAVQLAMRAEATGKELRRSVGVLDLTERIVRTEWNETITNQGVSYDLIDSSNAVANTLVQWRRIPVDSEVDRIEVRMYWNNTPTAYGDLLLGYDIGPSHTFIWKDAVNTRHEGPSDVGNSEWLVIHEILPPLRNQGYFNVGGGSYKDAVNVPYHIVVDQIYYEPTGPVSPSSGSFRLVGGKAGQNNPGTPTIGPVDVLLVVVALVAVIGIARSRR